MDRSNGTWSVRYVYLCCGIGECKLINFDSRFFFPE